jgi:proteasome lid subunit RPN8/RPN11
MIRIEQRAWRVMREHAEAAYPRECCGILLGTEDEGVRTVAAAMACRNAYEGAQHDRFELDAADQFRAQRVARELGLDVLGFFHSHPDCGAYFSATDLKYSWPWYSNVVLSVLSGKFAAAASFHANEDQTASTSEAIEHPKD